MKSISADHILSQQSFTDLNSLQGIRTKGRENTNEALGDIAKQFESMLVRMMLQSMRDANAIFSEGNPLSSSEGDMYQQMYDDQLALTLGGGRGIGIAEVMVKQLIQAHGNEKLDDNPARLNREVLRSEKPASRSELQNPLSDNKLVAPVAAQSTAVAAKNDTMVFDGSVQGFVKKLYNMAKKAADTLGQDPAVLLAQAALETGWGKKISHDPNKGSSHNLFNIKADHRWEGEKVSVSTLEFRDGIPVRETAAFRAYDSLADSFKDYVTFVSTSARYQEAVNSNDATDYIQKLKQAGYATDPAYAEKILRIMQSEPMQSALSLAERSPDMALR